jgi:hypothetical protein
MFDFTIADHMPLNCNGGASGCYRLAKFKICKAYAVGYQQNLLELETSGALQQVKNAGMDGRLASQNVNLLKAGACGLIHGFFE